MTDGLSAEEREYLLDDLYSETSAEAEALEMLRADMEQRGLAWEEDSGGSGSVGS